MKNFEKINIGSLIRQRAEELQIDGNRICNFFACTENEMKKMYEMKSMDSDVLLRWCKLLEYDFFRIYSQHLIFFSPPAGSQVKAAQKKETQLPQFRKNVYTKEIIDFILELIETKGKTRNQIIEEYKIPKTTLYKWIKKYER
ncbi:transposase [Chryseobacterium tongliaoense]|uniref:transposase n=1 Tax=Chryseobacterium tongliaoense TaxID=3240933 RepID=UPI003511939A